ncbi:hypothetical protein [Enterococcus sp. DIV0170]|uniref:hypothetical protein n=1 Tax=Enterococcus sp. DIV0170 TaxID=2774642 RepID=UPI003F272EF4
MLDRIWKMKTNHPIIAHIIIFVCWAIGLGVVDFHINKSLSSFPFAIPIVCFLGWLFESYYKVSSGKLWGIYFLILFVFLTIFDRDSWVDWTSSVIQIVIAALVASISVFVYYRNSHK